MLIMRSKTSRWIVKYNNGALSDAVVEAADENEARSYGYSNYLYHYGMMSVDNFPPEFVIKSVVRESDSH